LRRKRTPERARIKSSVDPDEDDVPVLGSDMVFDDIRSDEVEDKQIQDALLESFRMSLSGSQPGTPTKTSAVPATQDEVPEPLQHAPAGNENKENHDEDAANGDGDGIIEFDPHVKVYRRKPVVLKTYLRNVSHVITIRNSDDIEHDEYALPRSRFPQNRSSRISPPGLCLDHH